MVKDSQLDQFFSQLKAGLSVGHFLELLDNLYGYTRLAGMSPRFRGGQSPLKTLRDEVTPLARFVRKYANLDDHICKPLVDPPDFIIRSNNGTERTIECTTAGAVARSYSTKELEKTVVGRGFVGLADDEPPESFIAIMNQDRATYTTEQVYDVVTRNLKRAIKKKSPGEYGNTLLIEGFSLYALKLEAWISFAPTLVEIAKLAVNFNEVYFVGYHSPEQICMRIK